MLLLLGVALALFRRRAKAATQVAAPPTSDSSSAASELKLEAAEEASPAVKLGLGPRRLGSDAGGSERGARMTTGLAAMTPLEARFATASYRSGFGASTARITSRSAVVASSAGESYRGSSSQPVVLSAFAGKGAFPAWTSSPIDELGETDAVPDCDHHRVSAHDVYVSYDVWSSWGRMRDDGDSRGGPTHNLHGESRLVELLAAALESPAAVAPGQAPLTVQRDGTCQNDSAPLLPEFE